MVRFRKIGAATVVFTTLLWCVSHATAASRVELIRGRGALRCGIATRVAGFADISESGAVSGFEPDLCRAVAAAILGTATKVEFTAAESLQAFTASQDTDLVARRLTVTLRREMEPGIVFSPVVFYDGTGLMVRRGSRLGSAAELAGRKICVRAASEAADGLQVYFAAHALTFDSVQRGDLAATAAAFRDGRCSAVAADVSELGAMRAAFPEPQAFEILPGLLSKEPLAMLMHADDAQFVAIVRWTVNALIAAEELGVTQEVAASGHPSANPDVRRLLGQDPGNGAALGLDETWAADAIAVTGNYGEIFARNLGDRSPIKLQRGASALWRDGGLMYALPLR